MHLESDPDFFELFHKMKERNVLRLAKRFYTDLTERAETLAAEHGFPEMKMMYFGFLANLKPDGSTSKDLADCLKVSKQAISKMTQEIEQLGFIEFHPHATDGRASVIRLTEKGVLMLRTGLKVSEQIKAELAEKVGKKALDSMIDTLKILVENK